MLKPVIALLVVFSLVSVSSAQEQLSNLELVSAFKRLSATMKMSHRESVTEDSKLELVAQQRDKLNQLRASYVQAVNEYAEIVGNRTSEVAMSVLLEKYHEMETTLFTDVLLPHQGALLRTKVSLKLYLRTAVILTTNEFYF